MFQKDYFAADILSFEAMEKTRDSLYSDLHGWSPNAFEGLVESVEQMVSLISMSGPLLRQKSHFSPDILEQLSLVFMPVLGDLMSGFMKCSLILMMF